MVCFTHQCDPLVVLICLFLAQPGSVGSAPGLVIWFCVYTPIPNGGGSGNSCKESANTHLFSLASPESFVNHKVIPFGFKTLARKNSNSFSE